MQKDRNGKPRRHKNRCPVLVVGRVYLTEERIRQFVKFCKTDFGSTSVVVLVVVGLHPRCAFERDLVDGVPTIVEDWEALKSSVRAACSGSRIVFYQSSRPLGFREPWKIALQIACDTELDLLFSDVDLQLHTGKLSKWAKRWAALAVGREVIGLPKRIEPPLSRQRLVAENIENVLVQQKIGLVNATNRAGLGHQYSMTQWDFQPSAYFLTNGACRHLKDRTRLLAAGGRWGSDAQAVLECAVTPWIDVLHSKPIGASSTHSPSFDGTRGWSLLAEKMLNLEALCHPFTLDDAVALLKEEWDRFTYENWTRNLKKAQIMESVDEVHRLYNTHIVTISNDPLHVDDSAQPTRPRSISANHRNLPPDERGDTNGKEGTTQKSFEEEATKARSSNIFS